MTFRHNFPKEALSFGGQIDQAAMTDIPEVRDYLAKMAAAADVAEAGAWADRAGIDTSIVEGLAAGDDDGMVSNSLDVAITRWSGEEVDVRDGKIVVPDTDAPRPRHP